MDRHAAWSHHTFQSTQSSLPTGMPSTLTRSSNGTHSGAVMLLDFGSSTPSASTSNLEEWENTSAVPDETQPVKEKRRRHHVLTLGMKLKIIKDVEQGVKKTLIQKQYKLPPSTLSTILASKEDIKKSVGNSDYSLTRRRIRKSKYYEMEEQLWNWYKEQAKKPEAVSLTNNVICNKAMELANQMDVSDFKATTGWVYRFRQRRGINRSPAAKLAKVKPPSPASPDLIEHWTSVIVPDILRKYDPNDIFIAHETGLFYRCTPDKMLPFIGETCGGAKFAKDRLTVMLVCNLTGTQKLPLLVVGRYARPRSMSYVQTLPTEYVSNKKSWMLPMIFEEWIKKFDGLMENSWRRVALFVTPCASHTHVEDLNSVTLVFLPPDLNLQPANHGIVHNLKLNYRRIVIEKFLDRIEQMGPYTKLPITVFDALMWLREAWSAVTPDCIIEGFKKAGFDLSDDQMPAQQEIQTEDYYTMFEKLTNALPIDPLVTAEGYLNIDSHVVTIGTMTTCEMMVARRAAKQPQEDDEDNQDEELEVAPTVTEARQSLATLLKYFGQYKGQEESLKYISEMEVFIHKLTGGTVKQMTMLDFFTRSSNKRSTRVPKQTRTYFFPRS